MIHSAENSDYPKFVADQVLTSDNLNNLFGYLDEQGRMTRTNLSGIGIVCGLEVKTAADGSSITITKGVGVTSSGYLVSVPEIKYTKRTSGIFDAVKSEYYNKFVNVDSKKQKFNLWELKQEAESEGTTGLTKTFLAQGEKIVLLFVELLEENNKNCDPNSCDDKGITVTVNIRPLLIEKANVGDLLTGAGENSGPWLSLPELTMRRFDITANPLFESLNFFDAYLKILNNSFIDKTQTSLTKAYNVLQPLLADDFPTNPFATLAKDFKFLNDGSITPEQLIAIQYYYDLFSDILQAYNEFRIKGIEFIGLCCPDDIFPRHLLLDMAIPDNSELTGSYRHYFIPSPILTDHKKTATHLKILFKKLVLLVKKFTVPTTGIKGFDKKVDSGIRITPSVLANVPLSAKAIPYYYNVSNAADELLKNWNPEKLLQGKSTRNLSFHASKYNNTDEEVYQPLLYDLEPYNFLRIEGHIGKSYQHAVKNISYIRDKNRLPFDIVALSADVSSVNKFIKDITKLLTSGTETAQATVESIVGTSCHFNDLELLFDSIMAELTGKLSNEMKFFYDLKRDAKRPPLAAPASDVPQVPLLKNTDGFFRFGTNTMGHEFELYYTIVKDLPFIPLQVYFQSFGQEGNNDVMDFVFKAVLYYIEMLYETITTSLSSFTYYDFYIRYYTLIQAVRYIKLLNKFSNERFPLSEEENDHLDGLLSITADSRMLQLYMEFLRRLLHVKIMQQAGFYLISNPGIQHKAGVPFGGTFILIYHETEKPEEVVSTNQITKEKFAFKTSFVEARENTSKTNFVEARENTSTKIRADEIKTEASVPDHLQTFSAGVTEKMDFAKERIISGLKRTINKSTLTAEKATKVTAAEAKVSETSNISAINEAAKVTVVTTTEKSQDINQRILNYLADAANYLKNRKEDALDEAIADFGDGVVIADFYLPYLCCSDCPPIQMIVTGQPEPNQAPIARPGDQVSVQLPENSVTLDGSASSDPDGSIKSYLWELQSGTGAKIENPAQSKTNITSLKEGTYVFKLTVTDDDGATNSATVTVIVLPAKNIPPVAAGVANPDTVVISADKLGTTQLIGSGSKDTDGQIVSWKWSLSSGPTSGSVISNPDNETTIVSFTQQGSYVFKLTVTDDKGASDSTAVAVTVTLAKNNPPVAVASATPTALVLVPGQQSTVVLDGKGSTDTDGQITSFSWSLLSGPTSGSVINNPDKETTIVSFNQAGSYLFNLTVTDDRGASDSATVAVTVTLAKNNPPVAVASATPPALVLVPGQQQTSTLTGKDSTDTDGTITKFNWSLTSGPTSGSVINNPESETTLVSFNQPGNYLFKLTVTDDRGASESTAVSVVVTQEVIVQKTCAQLNRIIADFDKISGADTADNFKIFTLNYPDFREISIFFELMKSTGVLTMNVNSQIKFFIKQEIESRLLKWIDNIRGLIFEFTDIRLLILLTFNVLTELAYYISCIQSDDVNKAEVKMFNSLLSVNETLQNIIQLVPDLKPEHRRILLVLQKFSTDERTRLKNNGDEALKANYAEILESILSQFKEMNL